MQQFLLIAAVHFLALLSPGPDFFLIARTSLAQGWCIASGACVGIAAANGLFIIVAFSGTSAFRADGPLFLALQLAGCGYLGYLGILFIRHAGRTSLSGAAPHAENAHRKARGHVAWARAAGSGFLSGILNPKNALFYASLAAMLTGQHVDTGWKLLYGVWMFIVVLGWDLLVAMMIGNHAVLGRFSIALPWLERMSGAMLLLLSLGVLLALWAAIPAQ